MKSGRKCVESSKGLSELSHFRRAKPGFCKICRVCDRILSGSSLVSVEFSPIMSCVDIAERLRHQRVPSYNYFFLEYNRKSALNTGENVEKSLEVAQ